MISCRLAVLCFALLSVAFALALPRTPRNVQSSETLGKAKFFSLARRNISLGESNMPTSWQVQAAELAVEVYELQSTDSGRLQMISELFSDLHPYWYWNIALNYRHIQHRLAYYVEIFINEDHLYIFSST